MTFKRLWRDFWQEHWGFTHTSVIKSLLNRTFMLWKSYSTLYVSLVFFEEDGCSHKVSYSVWIIFCCDWINRGSLLIRHIHTHTQASPVSLSPSHHYCTNSSDLLNNPTIQFTSTYIDHSKQPLLETIEISKLSKTNICYSFFKTQDT